MAYLFPFGEIPAGSKIILYGMGEVGKDFYLQLHELRDRYELLAWTATTVDAHELERPFDYTRNIPSYPYDYVVIAVMEEKKAIQIKETLDRLGVPKEKQIWLPQYYAMSGDQLPTNRKTMLKNLDFYMDILAERRRSDSMFGGASFYQSYSELGLRGQRNSGERIILYHLNEYLKKTDEVLDVGCNCGFFDLQMAPMVKHVTGCDLDEHLIRIANRTKRFIGCDNANFLCGDFWQMKPTEKRYQAVFACAIHYWVISGGVSPADFVGRLYDALTEGGYLFFESQDLGAFGDRELFEKLQAMFLDRGMECLLCRNYRTDFEREIVVLRKMPAMKTFMKNAEKQEKIDGQLDRLCAPTKITKINETYFIVDCWHHRILCSDLLSNNLKDWQTLPGKVLGGHTIAGNENILLADSTDTDQLLCFRKNSNGDGIRYELRETIDIRPFLPDGIHGKDGIRLARPHSILYDAQRDCFLVAVGSAGCLLLLRARDQCVVVEQTLTDECFQDAYLKFVKKVDEDYWLEANGKLIRFQIYGGKLKVLSAYSLPPYIHGGMVNDFAKIGNRYYLTTYEQYGVYELVFPNAAQGTALSAISVGRQLKTKGIPYLFSEFDGSFWLTEIQDAQRIVRLSMKDDGLAIDETLFSFGAMTAQDRAIRAQSPLYKCL
ncbi:MAG: class I SAM-dependent methyltransferase [Ruminococcaceae bacterium]|nr:class I SAM-dependent methyltransferase [Oscillospiraceae bacterium]